MRSSSLLVCLFASVSLVGLSAVGHPLASPSWQVSQSLLLGVAFADESTGYLVGGDNGVGNNALVTTDAGDTFTSVSISQPAALFLSAIAAQNATSACLTGINLLAPASQYTLDGVQFHNASQASVLEQGTQDIQRVVGEPEMYVTTGTWQIAGQPANNTNGIAISRDNGQSFEWTYIQTPSKPWARYGAFPSPQVGFVSSGSFPNNNEEELVQGDIRLNHHLSVRKGGKTHSPRVVFNKPSPQSGASADDDGYLGSIQRSTDGFVTWTTVLTNDTMYYNQISCPSTQICYIVGMSPTIAVVLKTVDGGDSWQEVFVIPNGVSLSAVQAISEKEVFIGGGITEQSGSIGYFYHTVDGGSTWDQEILPGYFIYDFDFLDADNAFAVAINNQTQFSGQQRDQHHRRTCSDCDKKDCSRSWHDGSLRFPPLASEFSVTNKLPAWSDCSLELAFFPNFLCLAVRQTLGRLCCTFDRSNPQIETQFFRFKLLLASSCHSRSRARARALHAIAKRDQIRFEAHSALHMQCVSRRFMMTRRHKMHQHQHVWMRARESESHFKWKRRPMCPTTRCVPTRMASAVAAGVVHPRAAHWLARHPRSPPPSVLSTASTWPSHSTGRTIAARSRVRLPLLLAAAAAWPSFPSAC